MLFNPRIMNTEVIVLSVCLSKFLRNIHVNKSPKTSYL